MGIYFDNTTIEEDCEIILQGIEEGVITKNFYWPKYEENEPFNDNDLVWISLDDSRQHLIHHDYEDIIIINGIPGKLTQRGCDYICNYLLKNGKFSTTL